MSRTLFTAITVWMLSIAAVSCDKVDDHRTPYAPVYIPFTSQGVWDVYGVNGAALTNRFIKPQGIPQNYPYTDLSQTGFGGVLLAGAYDSSPRAYDLSCPVEVRRDVIIYVDTEENVGVCPECGSTYDIFNAGGPLSGPAAAHGYGLTRYKVGPGNNVYMAITN